MKPAFMRQQAAQGLCWEGLHVATRCGLRATQPTLMRIDLGLGRWLVHRGLFDDRVTNPRWLRGTARDEALPRGWRSVPVALKVPVGGVLYPTVSADVRVRRSQRESVSDAFATEAAAGCRATTARSTKARRL